MQKSVRILFKSISGKVEQSKTQIRKYSVHGSLADSSDPPTKRITLSDLSEKYINSEPITMMTATDFHSSSVVDQADMDIILVGDSLGMTALGYDSTVPVTMDDMIHHSRAVVRGSRRAFLVGDMPFGSYEFVEDAVQNAVRFMKEAQVQAVKLEGGQDKADQVKRITKAGIPVVGHIGLTPQAIHQLGGYKVVGKTSREAMALWEDALAIQDSGAKLLVLECVPHKIATQITKELNIPTIGIGSGPGCSGQVLVYHDVLGMYDKFTPKFSKHFLNVGAAMKAACSRYNKEVKARQFPEVGKHTFIVKEAAFTEFVKDAGFQSDIPKDAQSVGSMVQAINNVVVLGSGAVGTLIAAKLKESSNGVNITLTTGRQSSTFGDLVCLRNIQNDTVSTHKNLVQNRTELPETIDLLVVATKNFATEQALTHLMESGRVKTIKSILTIQNGAGNCEQIGKVMKKYFQEEIQTFQASLYTGAKFLKNQKELLEYTGEPIDLRLPTMLGGSSIAKLFTDSKDFSVKFEAIRSSTDWKKLIVNCVINPLTALFGVKNGEISQNPHLKKIAEGIVEECISVGKMCPDSAEQFSSPQMTKESLIHEVFSTAQHTADNYSSMLRDTKGLSQPVLTEIDSLNGFIVHKASLVKLPVPYNDMMATMIKAKCTIKQENQWKEDVHKRSGFLILSDEINEDHIWEQMELIAKVRLEQKFNM